jgi:hypothetical protein
MRLVVYLAIAFLCVHASQWLAARPRRSETVWMWAVALLGPVPLAVLACLPNRKDTASYA